MRGEGRILSLQDSRAPSLNVPRVMITSEQCVIGHSEKVDSGVERSGRKHGLAGERSRVAGH